MEHADAERGSGTRTTGPPREITVNQAVAWNVAWLRRTAGLTQEQLGERIGWTGAQVSEAERSWSGKRTREFDAQALAAIAIGLSIPLSALFLPPADENAENLSFRDGTGKEHGMRDLMRVAIPDNDEETPVMDAYRRRWNKAGERWFGDDPDWMRLVARWVGDIAGRRAEVSGRLRAHRDALLGAAAEYGELADEIEGGGR